METEGEVERSSLTASQVIRKLENSSQLYQDTVSSRMKKVSAEEFHLSERKVSSVRTAESSEEGTTDSLDSSSKASRSKSMSAVKKSSIESKKDISTTSITSSSLVTSAVSESKKSVSSQSLQTSSETSIKRSSQEQKTSVECLVDSGQTERLTNGTSSTVRTTMVVRLTPGESRRLSAFLDQKSDREESVQSWLGDVQSEDNPSSVCGLEISFSSIPQDIDIKLIPGNKYCNINNKDNVQLS